MLLRSLLAIVSIIQFSSCRSVEQLPSSELFGQDLESNFRYEVEMVQTAGGSQFYRFYLGKEGVSLKDRGQAMIKLKGIPYHLGSQSELELKASQPVDIKLICQNLVGERINTLKVESRGMLGGLLGNSSELEAAVADCMPFLQTLRDRNEQPTDLLIDSSSGKLVLIGAYCERLGMRCTE